MGMTMTQKILAAHAGLDHVEAGQLIDAKLDMVLGNDITSPVAINEFEKCGADSVFDNTRIALVLDHFAPNKDIKAAEQCRQTRAFAGKYDDTFILKWLKNFYRRFFAQQFKRSCLPDGPKVGSLTLSPRGDWRMPSDAVASLWLNELEKL